MRRSFAMLALVSAAGCSEHSVPTAAANEPAGVTSLNDTIAITVNPANVGPVIPANFMGLSFQGDAITDARLGGTAMVNVLKTLGAGVLRINAGGGGSRHLEMWWTPGARVTRSDSATVLIGADFDRLFQLCAAANWTAIVGVNFAAALPDTFAAEAAFIQARGGPQLAAVEIGNEPDDYQFNGVRSAAYTFAAYATELTTFLGAMQRRAPGVPIAAPATSYDSAWLRQTIALNPSRFALATQHRYPTGNDPTIPATSLMFASIPNLLSDTVFKSNFAFLKAAAAGPRLYSVPARLAETNSAYFGGKPGMSNVFASALWAIDHSFSAAEAGLVGVNFHNGGLNATSVYAAFYLGLGGTVAPLNQPLTARPLLYGLLAFQDAAKGQVVNVATISRRRWNLTAHGSVTASDGTVRLALVNKDTATLTVRIVVPNATTVTVRRLNAGTAISPLSDSTGVTYAGAKVTTTGTFTPVASETIMPVANTFVVSMPFASAAVLVVTAK